MTNHIFPITNHSSHHFTSEEIHRIRKFIGHELTIDDALRAEINSVGTEISCSTRYGFNVFPLEEIFKQFPDEETVAEIARLDDLRHG